MASVTSQSGLKKALSNQFAPAAAEYPSAVRLYTNNITPTVDSVVGDFTVPVAAWYAEKTLTGWSPPTYVAPRAKSSATPVVWTNTGSIGADVIVYGYCVVDTAGVLVWAERDPLAPVTIVGGGGTYEVAIERTNKNE